MASACLNNVGIPTENFHDCSVAYEWLSPRISLSRDGDKTTTTTNETSTHTEMINEPDLECSLQDFGEFEFRLEEDPVTMLPADELFADGKLVPLHLSFSKLSLPPSIDDSSEVRSESPRRRTGVANTVDPFLFSPKAPRCSSRWKDLLGFKKFYQNNNAKSDKSALSSSSSAQSNTNGSKSRRIFLHRSSKSSVVAAIDSSINLPLLKDPDSESSSGCISSRLSLSSSSSSHEHDEMPRLSLDSEKPILSRTTTTTTTTAPTTNSSVCSNPPPKVRVMRQKGSSSENPTRASRRTAAPATDSSSVDSPRMNSSGKVVFQSLERSSSSPSTFNGGPRLKLRGMERSYSANLRVTHVLNVPVCSLSKSSVFGFPLFSSPQKREVMVGSPTIGAGAGGGVNRSRGGAQHYHQPSNRSDRT
ncbi:uncharacterized serine-rich protein C215.13-like [Impatiens glandulifera]|uniref:uncharacterized serine-rich protein C215.13-like n=1 Tax=Impatiens glandulifera TaxID=253017 RepID=UPI001FB09E33|nr:uncharacterized serine-rich protein C215.13-like [Impatiens glandulifera]